MAPVSGKCRRLYMCGPIATCEVGRRRERARGDSDQKEV